MLYPVKNDNDKPDIAKFRSQTFQVYDRLAREKTRFLARESGSNYHDRRRLAQFAILVLMANDLAEHRRVPMVDLEQYMGAHRTIPAQGGYLERMVGHHGAPVVPSPAEACQKALRIGLCAWADFSQKKFDLGEPQSERFMNAFHEDYKTMRVFAFELTRLSSALELEGASKAEMKEILNSLDQAMMPRMSDEDILNSFKKKDLAKPIDDDAPLPA